MKIAALCLFLSFCAFGAKTKKPWTVLVYVAGDEADIDRYSRIPLRKMEQVGSSDERWIVAHADLHFDESGTHVVDEPAVRYEIGHFPGPIRPTDYETLKIKSPLVWKGDRESNSASGEELAQFVKWGMSEYPAERYALFLLGHSWGWRGVLQDFRPGFVVSTPVPGRDFTMMPIHELQESLIQILGENRLDWLVMDTCHGAVLEIVYALRNVTRFFTGSTTQMGYMSFDYEQMLRYPWGNIEDVIRASGRDLLKSFARGGSQVLDEGDYSAIGLVSLKTSALNSLWPFLSELKRLKEFPALFLGGKNGRHRDLMGNVDLFELMMAISETQNEMGLTAKNLLTRYGVSDASDEIIHNIAVPNGAKRLRLWIQGDEVASPSLALSAAKEQIKYLNPDLTQLERAEFKTFDRYGDRFFSINTAEIEAFVKSGTLPIRPFIAGATWARVEWIGVKGEILASQRISQDGTYFFQDKFPQESPYLFQGHTSGAQRNRGLAVQIQPDFDAKLAENYALVSGEWVFGQRAYADTVFSKVLGWGALIFQN